ncbi:VCBS repeat-containing protein [Muricauda sp. 2012CJ35-5]|uniref:VCBS repeat-containing protein n=1 Tax=Flagellimonas spongiicola TaxID=2942208 RepID=A0ABT0PTP5_9FLAO|nr:VCBS repeat-containing protein [Allomuricauda spongiicola]MCL6274651.1 VCBS repeat-containing protein [Allomuricauda spongiicola]
MRFSNYLAVCIFVGLIAACNTSKDDPSYVFENLDSNKTNITFVNRIVENELTNSFVYEYVYNGGGVAVGDLNNDGLDDIYFTSNLSNNALYLNQGDLEFKDITNESGTKGAKGWSTGTNMVDINNDGLLDIYICKSGPYSRKALIQNELYVNQGVNDDGIPTFKEDAETFGLADTGNSIQSAFFDYDQDGDLDMYLMNHNPQTMSFGNKESISAYGDRFYENQDGKFVNVTEQVGIFSNDLAYGLGIGIGDLNNDGWPDLYVSNDYDEPDYLYLNQRDKTFKEVGKKAMNHMSNFSMGNDIADFDNDGHLDIITLDMVSEDNYGMKTSMASMNPEKFNTNVSAGKHYQYMYNALQKHSTHVDSSGTPFFSDIAQMTGISNTDWSWAPLMADFDNDGLKDIFITNGIKRDFRNKDFDAKMKKYLNDNPDFMSSPDKVKYLINETPNRPYENYFYKNQGGLKFENSTQKWVKNLKSTYSNGAAYTDLDNDGDLDIVINNVDEKASIYKNNSNLRPESNFIKLQFTGPTNNRMGIGAKIEVYSAGQNPQLFENYTVRGYQSSVSPVLNIGLGITSTIDSIVVKWNKDQKQTWDQVAVNSTTQIVYDQKKLASSTVSKILPKIFNISEIGHEIAHTENDFDDYLIQVLLPHKLSNFGPAVAIGDVNGDNKEDIYFGQSSGEASALYLQTNTGTFKQAQSFEQEAIYEDVDAKFLDFDNDGDLDLYVITGGNEFEEGSANYHDRLYENRSGRLVLTKNVIPELSVSGSKIRLSDFNQDGFIDVFVGGRFVPHDYPAAANSYLLLNTNGKFIDVTQDQAPELMELGLVTDAVWIDIDKDNDLDLCVVGEWMAPTVFHNQDGRFIKSTLQSNIDLTGWYYAIKAMDIDNDGNQDLVLGNLGENYKYKANASEPFEVFYSDFDNNGSKDLVLGYYNFGDLYPVRGRECSSQQMPSIKKITPSYDVFGKSTVKDIYGQENLSQALHLSAYNFKSGILKNKGDGSLEFIAFPEVAQISSINAILDYDYNADGLNDLIIAGNLFASEIETPRNDAGYGLLLNNRGDFKFEPIDAADSGLFLSRDTKNMEFLQISGKPHIAVGKNNELMDLVEINSNPKP